MQNINWDDIGDLDDGDILSSASSRLKGRDPPSYSWTHPGPGLKVVLSPEFLPDRKSRAN
ncbi:hypothetical protein M404DRAFT_36884 [Pisolithus tinctorius Marx 270]|uniref:Uncharacterized protein n=1 Tax=Pisolithus tinctorius Marx 270 TaxID=870435 RepID=A0A0C3I605_PISTI|nr:hypothetical protein M404DRAFT_36885 [Pisolithus tinctorius Marx 270]KIN92642.1 hypothetical protein M404DRAFT_36884 [Pisolithus tinctorius Marx 270]